MTPFPFGSTVLRLAVVGVATVVLTTVLTALWFGLAEGFDGFDLVVVYLSLAAGTVLAIAVGPSYVAWFLLVWLLVALGLPSLRAGISASAVIAFLGGVLVASAFVSFAAMPSDRGSYLFGTALSLLAAAIAALLTRLLLPAPKAATLP